MTVVTQESGHYLTINNTEQALKFLLREWPPGKSDRIHATAKKTLISTYHSQGSVDEARDAFLAAAVSAGIAIKD
ncbi:DUF982 domain-containing protein [Rhizobium sp. LEGMi198b]|uniref:DUF982 domain-containing protein n=1 Tax=unclassified Rhizobium TaxID=2613769 RepID=UPI00131A59BF|nr:MULTISPECIES: DUF982 domain-containing protein [Rhizobium]MDK4742325.1 DUF982 domain-containing protein [Rhizobium sp. CNPSo 3464]UWU23679.1 DUF982 domain-containing protein [Rhizobium tropici]WFU04410.1 DUF982 domain-containing protein [Rhizobium sp. CB3171]